MGFLADLVYGKDRGLATWDLDELTGRSKFSDYLPWLAWDPETKLYTNSDNTTGFLWECGPLVFADRRVTTTLEGLMQMGLPFGTVLQFILYADNYIDDYLDLYRKGKLRESELVHRVTDKYIEFLRKGTGGMEVFMRTPIRNFRLFVALKLPSREKLGVELNYLDIYANASEILNGAMLYPRDVPPEDLVDWMRKIFNDKPSLNNKHYSPEIPLNRQVIFAEI